MALLEVEHLSRRYAVRPRIWDRLARGRRSEPLTAVDDVSFVLQAGEVLGIAGESGSGKSTTCMMVAGLTPATEGTIRFKGTDVTRLDRAGLRRFRKDVQIIFQDPYESLNPRFQVFDIVAEGPRALRLWPEAEIRRRVLAMLEQVGLPPGSYAGRSPHQMSGGERQRVGIASALVLEPDLVVADEPLSMLDVSIRAGIIDLMATLSRRLGFSALYVSHDLSVLAHVADRLMVMYLGRVVEIGPTREVIAHPRHPYTKALIEAVPIPDPAWRRPPSNLRDDVAKPVGAAGGCRFADRCPGEGASCRTERPAARAVGPDHLVACHAPV